MKRVNSREFKNRQRYYLGRVREGETLVVTHRGRPIARVEPVQDGASAGPNLEERLRELATQGHLRLATKPFARFRPVRARGKPASQMIIEDRR